MKRLGVVGTFVIALGAPAFAQDQPAGGGDEPPAPEGAPPEPAPAEEPAAPPVTEPPPTSDGMPPSEDEEPGVGLEEKKEEVGAQVGVGARVRYVTVPNFLLNLFVEFGVPMNSVGFALEVVRRKGNFDMVFGLEYEKTSPEDGFWGEKGETPGNPGEDPDFNEFDNFGLLGVDATFVWHKDFNDRVALRYGAGIGAGLVLGSFYQTDTHCTGPTTDTCVQLNGPMDQVHEKNEDVPPVVPIVNLLLGLRIKASDQISFNIEGGFRDMFYFGAGADYFF